LFTNTQANVEWNGLPTVDVGLGFGNCSANSVDAVGSGPLTIAIIRRSLHSGRCTFKFRLANALME